MESFFYSPEEYDREVVAHFAKVAQQRVVRFLCFLSTSFNSWLQCRDVSAETV